MESSITQDMKRLSGNELFSAWEHLKKNSPAVRARDAANQLNVSEAELIATQCGKGVTRLEADWGEFISHIPKLGRVMALTRNEYAVHERKGVYQKISLNGLMGLVLGDDIDLRIFLSHWKYGFSVQHESSHGVLNSFQFFDESGSAIHKIYLTDGSNVDAYLGLINQYKSQNQSNVQLTHTKDEEQITLPDSEINQEGFINGWRNLKDTHDFFMLLRQFCVSRTQALRIAPPDLAYQVDNQSAMLLLENVAKQMLPIMVFAGNSGIIQIHTGTVTRIKIINNWLNVLDESFNLHLNNQGINSSWVVKKPTRDGIVTSLELFDSRGENILMFFGKRKPGNPELETWRECIAELPLFKQGE